MSTPRGHTCTRRTPCSSRSPDAVLLEVAGRGGRGRQGDLGALVDRANPSPRGVRCCGEPVPERETGHVGLVDGDHRDVERGRRAHHRPAENERRGEMDDLRGKPCELADQPAGDDHRNSNLRVAGETDGRQRYDLETLAGGRRVPRRDDHGLMACPAQVSQHLQHGTGHAVDVRQEGLGHHGDPHMGSTTASQAQVGEPRVSCRGPAREPCVPHSCLFVKWVENRPHPGAGRGRLLPGDRCRGWCSAVVVVALSVVPVLVLLLTGHGKPPR